MKNKINELKLEGTVLENPVAFNLSNEPHFHFPLEFDSQVGKGKIKVIGKKELFTGNLKEDEEVTVEGQLERPRFTFKGKDMTSYQVRAEKVELK